jgi:1,4-dihydroxy-2-naphthoate octaprenyltransferase
MNTIKPNSWQAWLLASRPKTLGAILCPILIANALAFHHKKLSFMLFFLVLLSSVLLQVLANIVNDYGDFIKGADTKKRLGPARALAQGLLSKESALKGIIILVSIIIILGLFLVFHSGIIILIIGLLGLFLALWYTLGKTPLAYLGFAEVAVMLFFGPIPLFGAYFVQTGSFCEEIFALSISPSALSVALIMTNNLRDLAEDRLSHKRTLAVRFGQGFSRFAILILLCLSMLSPIIMVLKYSYSPVILCALLSLILPFSALPIILKEPISARFNLMLAQIGKSLYLYGLLMSVGIFCA